MCAKYKRDISPFHQTHHCHSGEGSIGLKNAVGHAQSAGELQRPHRRKAEIAPLL